MPNLVRIFCVAVVLCVFSTPLITAEANASEVLGVRQLMQSIEHQNSSVQVEGVVARIYPDLQLVTLIDLKEFTSCSSVTCTKLALPVSWQGEMPAPKDHLLLHGSIRKKDGKMLFVAESLSRVEKQQP